MVTWICLLAITVVVQRRRKEAGKMRAKWDEMKRVDEKRMAGEDGEARQLKCGTMGI